ncbi:MAG: AAA family ATPase [candidate division WOR-3 bacterium]
MIVLKKLAIEDFMSLKDVELDLSLPGVYLVEGINKQTDGSNGAGKSALLEAIFYALYGKTLRGSTVKGRVKLSFEKGGKLYTIERTPAKLTVLENGQEIKDLKSQLQQKLEEIVGMSYKTFQMLVYFSPLIITRWFIEFSDTERKQLFSEILGLDFLDTILELVKSQRKGHEATLLSLEGEKQTLEKVINDLESSARPALEARLKYEELLKALGPSLTEAELDSFYQSLLAKENELSVESTNLEYKRRTLSDKIQENLSKLSRIQYLTTCPTCLQPVSDNHKQHIEQTIQSDIENIKRELYPLVEQVEEVKRELMEIRSIKGILETLFVLRNQILAQENQLQNLEQYKKRVEEVRAEREQLEKAIEELKIWEKIFSPTGVKAYVLDDVVNLINEYLKYYSSLMNLEVSIIIDEKGKFNYSVDYKSLSSGERRRVEVALLFALRQVMPVPIDIVVIDEIFDHLDMAGLLFAQQAISEFKATFPNLKLFVVSHRNDLPVDYTKRIVVIKDEDGVTRTVSVEL